VTLWCLYTSLNNVSATLILFSVIGFFSLPHRVQTGPGARPASTPTNTGGTLSGVKWPDREADHSPPSSAEVNA
jgi:hypothetical protein